MSSPVFEPSSNGTAVSVAKHYTGWATFTELMITNVYCSVTATAGSDVVQSGRLIFDDFFQHLWPYIGNNTANVVFQMVKRLRLIRIDQ
ncbi:hypothetical protein TNCV_2376811 [Trichonephila clavipes]|nr:hypothetical protein TNCV_2376811 [Trichonephila clavipes]